MGKSNDTSVSGNYSGLQKYNNAKKEIMEKWPNIFNLTKEGRLRANNIWAKFKQRPVKINKV